MLNTDAQPDLVARLAAAAADAVNDQRQSLSFRPETVRSLVLELELGPRGEVVDGRAWVERAVRPARGRRA